MGLCQRMKANENASLTLLLPRQTSRILCMTTRKRINSSKLNRCKKKQMKTRQKSSKLISRIRDKETISLMLRWQVQPILDAHSFKISRIANIQCFNYDRTRVLPMNLLLKKTTMKSTTIYA